MGTPRGIGLASSAPHPNAAKLFLDYWLSKEAQQILAKDVGEYVLYAGVYPPIPGIDKAKVVPIRELTDDEVKKWSTEFKRIFEGS
jgi:iron(III) transport system substrate-binding protein